MIRTEPSGDRIRTYSDEGLYIRQDATDILYEDAVDFPNLGRTYTETNIPIPDTEATPDNLENSAQFLLARGLVEMPEQTEPDYFNESESEPDYFQED